MELTLTVCGRAELPSTIAAFAATHLVLVADPDEDDTALERFTSALPYHVLPIWDDLESADDPDAPTREDLVALIAWADALPDDARVIVCCPLGLSRSPAVAYGLLRRHRTPTGARVAVTAVRPQAKPSPAITALWERFYADAE